MDPGESEGNFYSNGSSAMNLDERQPSDYEPGHLFPELIEKLLLSHARFLKLNMPIDYQISNF